MFVFLLFARSQVCDISLDVLARYCSFSYFDVFLCTVFRPRNILKLPVSPPERVPDFGLSDPKMNLAYVVL